MTLASGIDEIDALAYQSWNGVPGKGVVLRYSFLTTPPADASSDDMLGFTPMTAPLRDATRAALATWAAVADVTFIEVADGGDIQFGGNDQRIDQSAGYAYFPDADTQAPSQVYLNVYSSTYAKVKPGEYGFAVLIHEIGHALGLKHPGNYNGTDGTGTGPFLSADLDSTDYTQMSYNESSTYQYTQMDAGTPMILDILALQYLYGPNMHAHAGDDTYKFSDRSVPQTIWDAGGYNTFDFSACTGPVLIDLRDGEYSATQENFDNIWIALGVTIQAAVGGAGDDQIFCGYEGSVVESGAGADLIFSGLGDDVVYGGAGLDTGRYLGNADQYLVTNEGANWIVRGEGKDSWSGIEAFTFLDKQSNTADMARLAAPLADYQALSGKPLALTLPAGAFTTTTGTPTMAASLSSGRPLPAWLTFDAATGKFSGTPGADEIGSISVRVSAANPNQVAVGDDFILSISASAVGGASVGNDVLAAGAGSQAFDGLAGKDTVVFAGARADFTITAEGTGFSVLDKLGSGGTDHLLNIERLQFGDATIALDIEGSGGQSYRLYQAAFNRTPDLPGLGYWISVADHGASLRAMASQFLNSSEFVQTYGALANTQFVTQLYLNVLHRQPDQAGLDYHLHNLDTGATQRVDTLMQFSESAENKLALMGVMENGFQYTPY